MEPVEEMEAVLKPIQLQKLETIDLARDELKLLKENIKNQKEMLQLISDIRDNILELQLLLKETEYDC